ncbi:hypothetical protein NGS8_0460 [Escherichia coli phage NG_S8]|uniref:Uncharacterized protein n=1 Tax=Escherichia phage GreteKellenberger TaxID=2851990 RepID=A0AAE7VSU1_9CAUD|nr:hypothetical protein bas26_0126 [Escherichia phage GreteKellenberger]BEU76572.1 hypothetical protein NGS8_0460 [Escherichia coli phage NG_S8]
MAQRVTVHLSREFPGRESRCNQLVVSVMSFGEPPQLKIRTRLELRAIEDNLISILENAI